MRPLRSAGYAGLLATAGSSSGCAPAPLVQGVGLSSYDEMAPPTAWSQNRAST